MDPATLYQLPGDVLPRHYDLILRPSRDFTRLDGEVEISLEIHRNIIEFVLNARDLSISEATVLYEGASFPLTVNLHGPEERVVLSASRMFEQGKTAVLRLIFSRPVDDLLAGFYRCVGKNVRGESLPMATTQFEATDARRAFPCLDEPRMKATFSITAVVPEGYTALSNMPVSRIESAPDGFETVFFARTPRMSTYLLHLSIGRWDRISTVSAGVEIAVHTPPGRKEDGRFALDVAARLLPWFNDYFGMPYPLPKLDLIAIADFAAGAMENWGAMTFRETALLAPSEGASARNLQRVAIVVAHEMAHQWFGDLVTMDWWDDLWLNEGFASWMEVKAVDWLYPEWGMWELFQSDDKNEALEMDSLTETHPIEVPVRDPAEINEIFDAISYTKGGSLLRMLEAALGPATFQNLLGGYFRKYAYANATTADLWRSLSDPVFDPAGGVGRAMSAWTRTPGYPYLRVSRSGEGLALSQRPFLIRSEPRKAAEASSDAFVWPLMLSVSDESGLPFRHLLTGREGLLPLRNPKARSVRVNSGQTGYFRVLYEGDLMEGFLEALDRGEVSSVDRLALENDLFAFVRSGLSSMGDYFALLERLKSEDSYAVWSDVAGNLMTIDGIWAGEPGWEAFRKWAASLARGAFDRVGWEGSREEPHQKRLLRATLLGLLVRFREQGIVEESGHRFARYRESPELLPADLRFAVFQSVVASGGTEAFDTILDLASRTVDQEEKNKLLFSLARTPDADLLGRALDLTLSPLVRVQDAVSVVGFLAKNPLARLRTFEFVTGHWEEFYRRYEGGGFALNRLVRGISDEFKEPEDEKRVSGFFESHPVPAARRSVAQALETIRSNGEIFRANRTGFSGFFERESAR
jgi:puromycin-sensitive aminopeptidase